jgi:murein L,D-transpeptidase YafK
MARARVFRSILPVLILGGFVASTLALAAWPPSSGRFDDLLIDFERARNRAFRSFGFDLPGTPDFDNLPGRLSAQGLKLGAPVLMRIFKREFALELWMLKDGKFQLFTTYPVCRWSGVLGPKLRQGDHQAPEGFYSVGRGALNPNSRWHRSFNLGFPNVYDRAHGRTGTFLMVHGGCSSVGCYAMTNAAIDEIWQIINAAFDGGQKYFQVQIYPFRMTEENLARRANHPRAAFWRDLKAGNDVFEAELLPPRVSVCKTRYSFSPADASAKGNAPPEERCTAEPSQS